MKGKILFDSGHVGDRIDALMDRLLNEGFLCDQTVDPLTLDKLKNYTAVVITNPRVDHKMIGTTNEEALNLYTYVKNGGGLCHTINYDSWEDFCNRGIICYWFELLFHGRFDQHSPKTLLEYNKQNVEDNIIIDAWDNLTIKPRLVKSEITKGVNKLFLKIDKNNFTSFSEIDYNLPVAKPYFPDKPSYNITEEIISVTPFLYHSFRFRPGHWIDVLNRLYSEYSKFVKDVLKEEEKNLFKHYGKLGVIGFYGHGRMVGIGCDIFSNRYIKQDVEKNANFKLVENILEYVSKPTLHKFKEEQKTSLSFIYNK